MGDILTVQSLTPEGASRLVQEIAKVSGHVEFPIAVSAEMHRLGVNQLQVIECCQTATVTHKPTIDEHGNFSVAFSGFDGGLIIHIQAVIFGNPTIGRTLIVTEVSLETWPVNL